MEMEYVLREGRRLRKGYTTGSCAVAAAVASATALLTGEWLSAVNITTPSGVELTLFPEECSFVPDGAKSAIRKDSGDDPDITNHMLVFALVRKTVGDRIEIVGGEGVGVVTKDGLDQPVGNAAINSSPRKAIVKALTALKQRHQYEGGFQVEISLPDGKALAMRTFNPRLGIVGGLSVLGTTGIVEPMSEDAILETIKAELSVRSKEDGGLLLLTPGSYGKEFVANGLNYDAKAVKCSNFVGDAIDHAILTGFQRILLVGHGGKLVKLAGGMMQTHSRFGDCRFEILATHGVLAGADRELIAQMADAPTVDGMLALLDKQNLLATTMAGVMDCIDRQLAQRGMGKVEIGCILYTNKQGIIGYTPAGKEMGEELGFVFE